MLKNITLRQKLIAGFLFVSLIAGGIGYFSIFKLRSIGAADALFYENAIRPMQYLAEIDAGFERASANLDYCLYERKTGDYLTIAEEAIGGVSDRLREYRGTLTEFEEKRLYEKTLSRWLAYKAYYATLKGLVSSGKFDEAVAKRKADRGRTRRACRAAFERLITYKIRNVRNVADYNSLMVERAALLIWLAVSLGILCAVGIGLGLSASISRGLEKIITVSGAIAAGELETLVDTRRADEIGRLGVSIDKMQTALLAGRNQERNQSWLKSGIGHLTDVMMGDPVIEVLAATVIREIAGHIEAQLGAVYIADHSAQKRLSLLATYAYTKDKHLSDSFALGEGIVGQAALEKKQILIKNVPEDYVRVSSALGKRVPRFICVTPFLYEDRLKGVVEIGTFNEMTDLQLAYLSQAMPVLAIALESAERRENLFRALAESQRLSAELQAQQEELRLSNEALAEKNDLLERQKKEVESARLDIEEKVRELALASRYKSEFLANMSHELRSPLNSMLLLAQDLAENREGNLTAAQVESARIIHNGGGDLLNLINEILDLSKIEAGRMDLYPDTVEVAGLAESLRASFGPLAADKGLQLDIVLSKDAPLSFTSDRKRVVQVMRNLLSNALKFTERGGVSVSFAGVSRVGDRWENGKGGPVHLQPAGDGGPAGADGFLSVAVKDTGIGIAPDQQRMIFEAFQQADGGTSRRYGGTGLGLSIAMALARLLGGEIQLESLPGQGSTFTLYLPLEMKSARTPARHGTQMLEGAMKPPEDPGAQIVSDWLQVADDRKGITASDRVILVIEEDPNFARVLCRKCREKGFKCVVSATGEGGLQFAERHPPDAVILGIRLPGMDGWAVLDALKEDIRTRHIPVHVISVEEATTASLRRGAIGHAVKPLNARALDEAFGRIEQVVTGAPKRVLVVEDDPEQRRRTVQLIGDGFVQVDQAGSAEEALVALSAERYDCMVLDLGLPDMDGRRMLSKLHGEGSRLPPVIIHTARELTREEEADLREYSQAIVIKDVRSQERLLDEVSLFLHRVVNRMPAEKQKIIRDLHDTNELLRDRRVLIVDDDMRTSFALSRLLSERGMRPLKADNGERALKLLDTEPDISLVLMDVMMPVMDGYEAISRIRSREQFRKLPIIALTAKAMPEDREKCLAAGANDYLSKPVEPERLFALMRVWLYR